MGTLTESVEQAVASGLLPRGKPVLVACSGGADSVALAVAVLAGMFLAKRMVGPIQALRAGAARIGSGNIHRRRYQRKAHSRRAARVWSLAARKKPGSGRAVPERREYFIRWTVDEPGR